MNKYNILRVLITWEGRFMRTVVMIHKFRTLYLRRNAFPIMNNKLRDARVVMETK
jgi:hypothetical protein